MSILEKMGMALDSRDEAGLNDCLHDDCKFTLHAAGKFCPNLKLSVGG